MTATVQKMPAGDAGFQDAGEEILEVFTEVMAEWGHYRAAAGLRFPAPEEICAAVARTPYIAG